MLVISMYCTAKQSIYSSFEGSSASAGVRRGEEHRYCHECASCGSLGIFQAACVHIAATSGLMAHTEIAHSCAESKDSFRTL